MSVEEKIDRLSAKIDRFLKVTKEKEVWVSASWITGLTGWNPNRMRQARDQGIIQYRVNDNGGIEYLLGSLPEIFIKKSESQNNTAA